MEAQYLRSLLEADGIWSYAEEAGSGEYLRILLAWAVLMGLFVGIFSL